MPQDQPPQPLTPQDERAGARGPRDKSTPASDMQADDAGTADSGGEAQPPATPAQAVMKQTSKTDQEPGAR